MDQDWIPPFLWPSRGILDQYEGLAQDLPYDWLPSALTSLSGTLTDLDDYGINWLEQMVRWQPDLRVALVVVVTPGGPTTRSVLNVLYRLTTEFESRLIVRICTASGGLPGPTSTLCFVDNVESAHYLVVGPHAFLGRRSIEPHQATLVLRPTTDLLEDWATWFDWRWQNAALLEPATVAVPALVPAKGDAEAGDLWQAYCDQVAHSLEAERQWEPSSAADVGDSLPVMASVVSLKEFLALPSMDDLFERIARIYPLGHLISVDKFSRVPPLECPIKPEWFGIDRTRKVGSIKRDVSYKISALTEEDTKKLEARRTFLSSILPKLSFSFSDGQRWIPRKAKTLLDRELARETVEGTKYLEALVKGNIDEFLVGQVERITEDANTMCKEFSQGNTVRQDALQEILTAVGERLKTFVKGPIIPKYALTSISVPPESATSHASPWGQFLQLLHGVAQYPRKCLSDRFFFRGVEHLTEDELADAMDILGDHIWAQRESRRVFDVAKREISLLQQLMEAEEEARQKCAWVMMIIEGRGEEVAQAIQQLAQPK